MKNLSKLLNAVLLVTIILSISACGKVSAPEPIQGSGYPHTYPRN